MKKAHRNFQVKPWMGCMGFLGFLGFLPKHGGGRNYLFFVFFAFFAWFFWGLLYKEPADERHIANEYQKRRQCGRPVCTAQFFASVFAGQAGDWPGYGAFVRGFGVFGVLCGGSSSYLLPGQEGVNHGRLCL